MGGRDDDMILASNWSWLTMGGTTTSQRLSPGRWVAVLNHVTHGDANQAPDTWEHTGDLGQTQPVMNQSIEFTVTENSATQTLQFGYGPRDLNLAVVPAPSGPAFNVRSDENYDQVADPGEPFVPDGIEFTLGSVHLADSAVTGSTSGSTVTFPRDNRVGARVMAVTYGHAAPPPESWSTWGYAEGRSRTIRYLIHEDVNDDCDQDPGDDRPAACAHWGPIDAMPTVPILPAATPVAGQVFVDTDGDGVRDPGETAPDLADLQVEFVPAWELEPDNEGNPFEWDAPRADVATDGAFDLGMVPKGSYGIATTAAGWKVTTPPVVVPSTGHSLGPVEVGIARTHVSGRLYVDTDGPGVRQHRACPGRRHVAHHVVRRRSQ